MRALSISEGHATIGKMFHTDEGRAILAKMFSLPSADWLTVENNQATFAGYGVASFPSQSNDPLCTEPACNIEKICNIMVNASLGDSLHRLAYLRKMQASSGLEQLDSKVQRKALRHSELLISGVSICLAHSFQLAFMIFCRLPNLRRIWILPNV